MQFNDDEEPPPTTKPAPARPSRLVRLSKYHSSEAPLAPNVQEVMLELKCVSSATYRAPLDLVAVVDVSGSMEGDKLKQAQEALIFIIRKLTDIDRLCIVAFEYTATVHRPLRRVTEAARTELEAVVRGLKANDGTSIKAGLQAGLSVVAQRRFTAGRAANIMLMSDGQDTIPVDDPGNVPVHTFGFGDDHYAHVLEAIANKSLGGVYNYVSDTTDPTNLSQTFSQILAGLVTIIPQDLELTVTAFLGEAAIKDVHTGAYKPIPAGDGSSSVTVKFGALYSSEVRRVIVELALGDRIASPSYHANVAQVQYRFTFQGQKVASDPVVITMNRSRRAPDPADESTKPPPVQAELVRLKHVGSIKAAKEKADQNNMVEAWNILAEALNKLAEAAKKLVDPMFDMLRKELLKMLELFKTWDTYQKRGKAFATSAISSHDHQRIAARGDAEEIRIFSTPRMDIYLEQAKHPGKVIKSADDDALEELEREPELEVPATPPAEKWRTLSVVLRLLTAVLSLLAFSIMASARTSGWAGNRYGRYEAYRYTVGVNVIVCFYSIAQALLETHRLVSRRLQSIVAFHCITLFLDQVLAYLLMSASSAAASRNHVWASRFGMDRFSSKINTAVWFSFLGFLALAARSLISKLISSAGSDRI